MNADVAEPFPITTTDHVLKVNASFSRWRIASSIAIAILFVVAVLFIVLYASDSRATYFDEFETEPNDKQILATCSGNGKATNLQNGKTTDLCTFTGDYTSERGGVSERYIAQLCNIKPDCGGYSVVTYNPYAASCSGGCDGADVADCMGRGQFSGRPQYTLWKKSAVKKRGPISSVTQGVTHDRITRMRIRK